jgi:menaquinone-dependent protoporphyrinogen oxidase
VYGTRYGQTAKIAAYVADRLRASDDTVMLVNADMLSRDFSLSKFDVVIVGGSIIRGRHQRSIQRFVQAHCDQLNRMPTAFFSVSGSAASASEAGRAEARRMLLTFLTDTGWHPAVTQTIGGAMAFTKYNPVLRWFLKRVSMKEGGPTDTSRDHELTDWTQVDRFADDSAALTTRRMTKTLTREA